MIDTLPLLPSTWKEWDWNKSNGNATLEQMDAGYEALLNQGLCASFSRLIWNDIVDCVSSALAESGIAWDATYCNASACKINARFGSLTATMFNSIALNIHRFGFTTWKWAVSKSAKGYVGRDHFNGYSTHKENADFLYGWYILELTKKVNKLIQVLKEEANFGEFGSTILSNATDNVKMFGAASSAVTFEGESVTSTPVPLSKAAVASQNASIIDYSFSEPILSKNPISAFSSMNLSKTHYIAESAGIIVLPISYKKSAFTISEAALSPLVFVGYMKHNSYMKTYAMAPLDISNIKDMAIDLMAKSYILTDLTSVLSLPIVSRNFATSYVETDLIYNEPFPIISSQIATSKTSAKIAPADRKIISSAVIEKSILESTLHRIYPFYIQKNIQARSYGAYEIHSSESKPLSSVNRPASHSIGDVQRIRPKFIDSEQISSSYLNIAVNVAETLRINAEQKSDSASNSTITRGIPELAEGSGVSTTYEEAEFSFPDVCRISQVSAEYSYESAILKRAAPKRGTAQNASKSNAVVTLELEAPEIDWIYPIVSDKDVFIQQVWAASDDGKAVHIDGDWLYPILSDEDVFIRQVYDAADDGSAIHIDVD